jgi:hypothetical protein
MISAACFTRSLTGSTSSSVRRSSMLNVATRMVMGWAVSSALPESCAVAHEGCAKTSVRVASIAARAVGVLIASPEWREPI